MVEVCMIVACDKNLGIGYKNRLPWFIPEDLKRFRKLTMGHTVVMGRKTFESLTRPLDGREMQVISNTLTSGVIDGKIARVYPSIHSVILDAIAAEKEKIFIIGGAEIYKEAIGYVDTAYVTWVTMEGDVDTYLKGIDFSEWRHEHDYANVYPTHRYTTYYSPWNIFQRNYSNER